METLPGQLERLPAGNDDFQVEILARTQRERILSAFAELVAKDGYQATSIGRVVDRAGVSRVTFYENFKNREACLLAAFDLCATGVSKRIEREVPVSAPWPEQVRAGLGAVFGYVADNPDLANTCFVQAITAGPTPLDHYELVLRGFAGYFRMGRKHSAPGTEFSDALEDTIVGGVVWVIHRRLLHGEAEKIPELLPTIVEFALAPYLGEQHAAEVASAV